MASFVLVHGGQHGAWCWEPVASRLTTRGHAAVAPELPGRDGGLEEHVDRVLEAIAECADPPVVVAHSMGGGPAALAVHRARSAVAGVVFAAAVVPDPGTSVLRDALGRSGALVMGALGSVPPIRPVARYLFGHRLSREDRQWVLSRLRRERMTAVHAPFPPYSLDGVECVYVLAARDRVLPPRVQARYAARLPGGRAVVVDGGHSLFAEHPDSLVSVAERLLLHGAVRATPCEAALDTRPDALR